MNCPNCATENRDGAEYCVACGAGLRGLPAAVPVLGPLPLICEACNAALRAGAQFCHRCGQPVVAQPTTAQVAAAQMDVTQPAPSDAAPPSSSGPLALSQALACPNCGSGNRATARFCLACGATLAVACGRCGADNRPGARFCAVCGEALATEAAAGLLLPSTTQPPPQRTGEFACEACGKPVYAAARFCPYCGKTPSARLRPLEARYSTGMMPHGQKVRGGNGDDYLVLRLIAQGGMGAVYEVGRMTDGTRWAMKEMSETALTRGDRTATVAKFQEEAALLRELRHENLPRVVDVFEFDRRHYLVMELIDGQTLGERQEAHGGPLPEKEVVDWGAQLCRVLAFLHTRQPPIIYRDLKPDNIMLDTATNRIKLIDFGIARRFKGGKKSDTLMLGTKGYAAPEQFGKGETDGRADLYALAATLHHLLTNEGPTNRRLFDFPPLSSYSHLKISRRTSEAIVAALALNPEDRPADAAAFHKALTGRAMPPPPQPATQPPPALSPPVGEPVRSRPVAVPAMLTGRTDAPVPIDLGTAERGQMPSAAVPVAITSGALPVESRAGWLLATPGQVEPGRNEVRVTAQTGSLPLGRADAPVTYRPRYVIDWLWWLLLQLYRRHVRALVPAPRRHQGAVRVGRQELAVSVEVAPAERAVARRRLLSVAVVALEMAVLISAIGVIIRLL